FSHDLFKALQKAWGEKTVGLSAWAVENALLRITDTDLILGDKKNGILIEGVTSSLWDKWCSFLADVNGGGDLGDGTYGQGKVVIADNGATPSPNLVHLDVSDDDDVDTSSGIVGGQNGIWIARGVNLVLSTFDDSIISQQNLDLKAWAILNAEVRIEHN